MSQATNKQDIDDRVIEYAYDKLIERWKSRALISEVDFLVGVMAAMTAATASGDEVTDLWPGAPPHWIFYAMGNRSVVASVLEDRGEEAMAKRARVQDAEFTYRYRYLDDLVSFLHTVVHNASIAQSHGQKAENLAFMRGEAIRLLEDIGEEWQNVEE